MNVALSCQRAFLGRHARAPSVATAAIAETAASEYADVAVKNSGWLVSFDMVVTGLPLISVQIGKDALWSLTTLSSSLWVMQKKGAVHVFLRLERSSDELNCI